MLSVERDQVLAFRLHSHHLDSRLPVRRLTAAAGACGVQNTPSGSAALALRARVDGLGAADLERAFADRALLLVWSVRGARPS